MVPGGSLLQSRTYRIACASSLALIAFVIARAPLWNRVLAGARVQLAAGSIALVAPAWQCSDHPYVCSTPVGGAELVARVAAVSDHPITCNATYKGQAVACTLQLWYAPQLKPFLELGKLPGVSFEAAMLERPWRLLDLGLLGEMGPLHLPAGMACAFLVALGAGALIRRGGVWWIARVAIACTTFVGLNGAWFMWCILIGYID